VPDTARLHQRRLAPWQVGRALRHIEANLDQRITIATLAALVGLSAAHFSRAFRGSLGMAPYAFVQHRRLERARDMMLTSSLGLSEIALACGFCDQPHLTNQFQRQAGISPAAWRRSRRETAAPHAMADASPVQREAA
jgi:transcriptional regulator GlxA family with amidase domain